MRLDDRGNSQSIEEVFVETRKAVAYFQKVHFGLTSAQQYWPHGLVPMEGLGALKETAVICFDGGGCHPISVRPKQIGWPCTAWRQSSRDEAWVFSWWSGRSSEESWCPLGSTLAHDALRKMSST